jgi:hypothetical protein
VEVLGINDTYRPNKGISVLQGTQMEVAFEITTSSKA